MTHVTRRVTGCLLLVLVLLGGPASAEPAAPPPQIDRFTAGMQHQQGYLPLYVDPDGARVYLEVPPADEELLYFTTLTQGLGSNDVGLDRGQVSDARRVRFERAGRRVLLTQPNLGFRAQGAAAAERLAVEQSFAPAVLFSFAVVAQTGNRWLVDATPFVLRDSHGAIAMLKTAQQGDFTLDADRSTLYLPGTRVFPENVELEGLLTFQSSAPGTFVKDVSADPKSVTLNIRTSLLKAPPPGYTPRMSLPGDGYFGVEYLDYAVALGEPMRQHYIARHRLHKKHPGPAPSEVVKPIVYYLDRGAPEPIRTALLEGARWWAEAFEAAGYLNAFRVELLPEGADPMDARYNVIQWVHRATRGWSYGSAVTDPLTGEIVKGNVSLGSLRVRYDYLLAEGLLSPYSKPDETPDAMLRFALARLSQLAAHEVGHTLGLSHNYIASAQNRASVMDYPVPLIRLDDDGELDLSQAYDTGIGDWDKLAITYGYADDGGGESAARAMQALRQLQAAGLAYITDADARPAGAALPSASLWDNGADAAAELDHLMKVRQVALSRFGENAIRYGMPLATLEEALVPIYLYHRYQVEATAKAVGGQDYRYALRGDGGPATTAIAPAVQRSALAALIRTLAPEALMLSPQLLQQIAPRPPGFDAHRELFARTTGLSFDPLSPAASAAALTIGQLLQPQRAARLALQSAIDEALPDLAEIIDALADAVFRDADGDYAQQVRFAEQTVLVQQLIALATTAPQAQVRAVAAYKLQGIARQLVKARRGSEQQRTQRQFLAQAIWQAQQPQPPEQALPPMLPTPPGSPLGG